MLRWCCKNRRAWIAILSLLLWPALGWGLPVRTGTPTQTVTTTADTGSFNLTVPTADLMVCALSGYVGTAQRFSTGSVVTIGGATMTAVSGGDGNINAWMSTLWYRVSPPAGVQSFAWNWAGTAVTDNISTFYCAWYTGVNLTTPVRSSSCAQALAGSSKTTTVLTAQSNDLIVAFGVQYAEGGNVTFTWSGATEVQAFPGGGGEMGDVSLAEQAATGNQSVSYTAVLDSDGAICAVTLAPPAAAGTPTTKRPVMY